MHSILHVLTRAPDSLACEIVSRQKAQRENKVEVVDLNETAPDYIALLQKIFEADSVTVW